jgi:MATE family multidrug resistance protein
MIKTFINLAIPNIIANLVIPLASLVDMGILGRLKDLNSLSGVTLGALIFDYIFIALNFFRMSSTAQTVKAQTLGSEFDVQAVLVKGVTWSFWIGIVLYIFALPLERLSLIVLNAEPSYVKELSNYYYARMISAPAVLSIMVLNGWYLGQKKAKAVLWMTLLLNLFNMALTYYFVMIANKGAWGAGLATSISNWIVFAIFAYPLVKCDFKKVYENFKLSTEFNNFFKNNFNLFLRTFFVVSSYSIFENFSALLGKVPLVANSLVLMMFYTFSYFIDGVAYSLEVMGGEQFHLKNKEGFKTSIFIAIKFGVLFFIIFMNVYYFFWEDLVSFINPKDDVVQYSYQSMYFLFVTMGIGTFAFILDGVFIGIGDSKTLRNNIFFAFSLCLIPFALFRFTSTQNFYLWWGLILFNTVRSLYLSNALRLKLKNYF